MNIPTRLFASVITLCVLSSCSDQSRDGNVAPPAPAPSTFQTPTNLAASIARTDRIVMTNRMSDILHEYRGYEVTLGGEDHAMPVVRAVSSARSYASVTQTNAIWDWTFWFYNGSNLLAVVEWHDDKFLFENREYHDESGVLDDVYRHTLFQVPK